MSVPPYEILKSVLELIPGLAESLNDLVVEGIKIRYRSWGFGERHSQVIYFTKCHRKNIAL